MPLGMGFTFVGFVDLVGIASSLDPRELGSSLAFKNLRPVAAFPPLGKQDGKGVLPSSV
jgi:hypothetical protein